MNKILGKAVNRVDGRLKVTGGARYSAEISVDNVAYGVLVESSIPKGRIAQIDTQAAQRVSRVLKVLTHLNMPKLGKSERYPQGPAWQSFMPMQQDQIVYAGQPVALVVAETLEEAEYAASLVQATYVEESAIATLAQGMPQAYTPEESLDYTRGQPAPAFAQADVQVDATYTTPVEHHNPIEPHSTTAVWDGEQLTVYEATQWVAGVQRGLSEALNLPPEQIRVISHYVGGAFGCKAALFPHIPLTAIAARIIGRPVKLSLTRAQMYTSNGYRPATVQHVRLGASENGQLSAILHDTVSQTSQIEDYAESPLPETTPRIYACPHVGVTYQLANVNAATPFAMRAPGEASCLFAIDSAIDELAYKLKLDPLELRLRNYAQIDPESGLPWSSKSLRECYQQGAERFGWSQRQFEPGSMRDGRYLVGWGMATALYPVYLSPAAAGVELFADGSALAQCSIHELGTGAYTAMTMVAAEALGLTIEQVRFELGDTDLPRGPLAAGSRSTASAGMAVQAAAAAVRNEMISQAIADSASPLHGVSEADITVEGGRMVLKTNPSIGETYAELLKRQNKDSLKADRETLPPGTDNAIKQRIFSGLEGASGPVTSDYSMYSFGAQFCEVKVDPNLGSARVTRYVGSFGAGRIINQKTAQSQLIGAITMSIGMALLEETVTDPQLGRIVNRNLGEYHVPVNADVPDIEAFFVDEEDPHIGPLGAKGVGEIGIVGVAPAVANAVFHATGKRIRHLPITPDKLL